MVIKGKAMTARVAQLSIAAGLLFGPIASNAQSQSNVCPPSGKAAACFVRKIELIDLEKGCDFQVTLWQLKASSVYDLANRYGRQMSEPERPDIHACVKDLKAVVEPLYAQARDSLGDNKEALSALKHLYSGWLSYQDLLLGGVFLVPTSKNIDEFNAGLEQSKKGLEERKNRLKIELL